MRKLLYAGAVAISLLAAGCGGAGDEGASRVANDQLNESQTPEPSENTSETTPSATGYSASPTSPVQASPTGPARIDAAPTSLGSVLVGVDGRTVYLFTKDKGGASACTQACAAAWPPVLTAGAPQAGTGVHANLLGTLHREDGTTQVTYNKHPLYYYAKDQKAGDVLGEDVKDFGGEWYAVTPEGKKAKR
ncbi:COG4315 family predicted lipoprotein [Microbispora rosea]|uniref:COG4315 family predicted lipoprotein n=1 Tax=Microbispora rosea TaxID=58117 RepID=UPI00342A8556